MKGQLQKVIESSALACLPCRHFRDSDPDIYYCELQRDEFPALCERYQQKSRISGQRTEWDAPDEL